MYLIDNKGVTDPRTNLALEEHCLRHLDPANEYLLFYINAPSVILGKHQIPYLEVDCEYAQRKGLQIVRRISGGGAVYHDYGNLNFSFITGFKKQKLYYFKKLIQPIVGTLSHLGIPAVITENNNIVLGGKKVSGTSQYTDMKRLLSHGTLLFASDLDVLNSVLISNLEVIQFRGVQSIPSEVTNISDHLSQTISMEAFRKELTSGISRSLGESKDFQLTPESWDSICRLSEEKYETWDWTYGRSPPFIVGHKFKFDTIDVYARIGVTHGIISDITIVDDYFYSPAILKKVNNLMGRRYAQTLMV